MAVNAAKRKISVQAAQHLKPGTLVLVQILSVSDDKLKLKLPFDSLAYAGFKSLGSAFLSQIKSKSLSFSDVFEANQLLCARIERRVLTQNYSTEYEVTLCPSEINSSLLPQKLHKHTVLQGFTTSLEDHGSTVHIGYNNYMGFATSKVGYKFGLLIVKEDHFGKGRAIQMDWKSKFNADSISEEIMAQNLAFPFLPGTNVSLKIDYISNRFISCKCGETTVKIMSHNLSKPISTFETGAKMNLTLLVLSQERGTAFGSTLDYIYNNEFMPNHALSKYHDGQTLKCMFLYNELASSTRFYRIEGNLAFETLNDKHELKSKLAKRSFVNCRILEVNALENILKVSTKRSTLSEKFINMSEVQVGSVVTGTIFKKTEKGLVVALSKNVYGFIYSYLFSDDPNEPFNSPEVKIGQKVKCHVLNKEKVKLNERLVLSTKKSLVESEINCKSAEEIAKGTETRGVVLKLYEKGALVLLPFGLKGWIWTSKEQKNATFHVGQTINAKVMKKNAADDKIVLSLVTSIKLPKGAIGQNVDCKIVALEEKHASVSFTFHHKEYQCSIDWFHLTDFNGTSRMIFDLLKEGFEMPAKIFSIDEEHGIKLTCKELLTKTDLKSKTSKLSKSKYHAGVVKSFTKSGNIEIELIGRENIEINILEKFSLKESDLENIVGSTIMLKSRVKNEIEEFKVPSSKSLSKIFNSNGLLKNIMKLKLDLISFSNLNLPFTCSVGHGTEDDHDFIRLNDNSLSIPNIPKNKLLNQKSVNIIVDYNSEQKKYIIADSDKLFKNLATNREYNTSNESLVGKTVEAHVVLSLPNYAICIVNRDEKMFIVYISRLLVNSFTSENQLVIKTGRNLAVAVRENLLDNIYVGFPACLAIKVKNAQILPNLRKSAEESSLKRVPENSDKITPKSKITKQARYFVDKLSSKLEISEDEESDDVSLIESEQEPEIKPELDACEMDDDNKQSVDINAKLQNTVSFDPNHPSNWLISCNEFIEHGKIDEAFKVLKEALSKISFDKKKSRVIIHKALINLHITYNETNPHMSAVTNAVREIGSLTAYQHAVSIAENLQKSKLALDYCTKLSKAANLSTKEGLVALKFIVDYCVQNYETSKDYLITMMNNKKSSTGTAFLLELKTYAASQVFAVDQELSGKMFEDLCFDYPKKPEIYLAYIVSLSKVSAKGDSQAANVLKRFLAINPKPRTLQLLKSKLNEFTCKPLIKMIDHA